LWPSSFAKFVAIKSYVPFAITDSRSETPCHPPQSSQTRGGRSKIFGPQLHFKPRCRPRHGNRDPRTRRKNVRASTFAPEVEPTDQAFLGSFPTVDFHMSSQRLAVGTNEGAIVMYDLKTATRLYVLECHKQALAACSFSPDGRRLVTVSLEEGTVLVWKVGSSFSSFFNPGAPPRQGHGSSEPFKSFSFNVGDAGAFTLGYAVLPPRLLTTSRGC
jgi:WD40 repeat protein